MYIYIYLIVYRSLSAHIEKLEILGRLDEHLASSTALSFFSSATPNSTRKIRSCSCPCTLQLLPFSFGCFAGPASSAALMKRLDFDCGFLRIQEAEGEHVSVFVLLYQ